MESIRIKNKLSIIVSSVSLGLIPFFSVFAKEQSSTNPYLPPEDFAGFVKAGVFYMEKIILVLVAISLLAFVGGIVYYFMLSPGDQNKRGEGRKFMLWGIVALFVMVSMWGIVNFVSNSVLGNGASPSSDDGGGGDGGGPPKDGDGGDFF